MKDYSNEKLVIRNGRMINYGELDAYDKVKTVYIANEFDIDDDSGNNLKWLENHKYSNEKTIDNVILIWIKKIN